jgi:hypothetical protein
MRVKFIYNLGITDATALKLNWRECQAGCEVEMPDEVFDVLKRNYPALVEGLATPAEIQAVPPKHGTVEKATADLKAYKDRQVGK